MGLGTDGGVPSSEGGGQSQRCWPCRRTCLPHLWTRTSKVGRRDSRSSRLHARGGVSLGPGPAALPMHEHARCPWSRASADPNVGQQGDPACRRGLCPSEERGTCDHLSVQQCLTREPLVTISRTNHHSRGERSHRNHYRFKVLIQRLHSTVSFIQMLKQKH